MRKICMTALAVLLSVSASRAQERLQHRPDFAAGDWSHAGAELHAALRDSIVYDNSRHLIVGPFFTPQPEAGDDLHLIAGGLLTAFIVGYYNVSGAATMTVTFYENTADAGVGAPVAGPYVARSLPPNFHVRRFQLPDSMQAFIGTDLWCAIRFDTPNAGVVFSHPPSVGTSHDLFWDFGSAQTAQIQGVPANFFIMLEVDTAAVAVEERTWSAIKALYRTSAANRAPTPP
ncbi:MAG: hypothetical protein JSW67_00425 [Candidatus Latescibacterota bacterium]|nr:MAG: hypothetical protein JSW67_00425 [Candidatus Latescibacterota bacterium]